MNARRGEISRSVAALLAQLLVHREAHLHATSWVVRPSGARFQPATIEAAYQRHLIKIVFECGRPNRAQRKRTAELTEIGEAAARGLIQGLVDQKKNRDGISFRASLMITEALSETVPGQKQNQIVSVDSGRTKVA